MIEQLPRLIPDAARTDRVAARCRAMLHRRRQKITAAAKPPGRRVLAIECAIGSGFCLIYLSAVFLTALDIAGGR